MDGAPRPCARGGTAWLQLAFNCTCMHLSMPRDKAIRQSPIFRMTLAGLVRFTTEISAPATNPISHKRRLSGPLTLAT